MSHVDTLYYYLNVTYNIGGNNWMNISCPENRPRAHSVIIEMEGNKTKFCEIEVWGYKLLPGK